MAPTRKIIMTRNNQTPSEVPKISMRLSNYGNQSQRHEFKEVAQTKGVVFIAENTTCQMISFQEKTSSTSSTRSQSCKFLLESDLIERKHNQTDKQNSDKFSPF